jgi:hypothetical protein
MLDRAWPYLARRPAVQIRCVCCPAPGQVLATVIDAALVIMAPRSDRKRHWVTYTWTDMQGWAVNGKLRCACCPPEDAKILAERVDAVLIIRAKRHGWLHFVTLVPERLQQLLASGVSTHYD